MRSIDEPISGPAADDDPTAERLEILVAELTEAVAALDLVRERAQGVLHRRARGERYSDIIGSKNSPFIAQMLSQAMAGLGDASSGYRRAQVKALCAEGCSVPDIAVLFGVTRQRVSVLLEERSQLE